MSYIGNVHPNVGKYHGKIWGQVWDFFVPKILISCWEFNIKSWECLSQYCKISWENVGPSLGFFCPQNTDFMLGIQCKKLGMFIPIL